ncbi:aminoglycoside phosphotransferase [Stanieria cyanosphaera PCC 7437]|uniref:Aminoglycoside phosphotransferase n=1 Tax=Stanieria cyanosphaera (strain ATCC 29371 / PCC 7437) TaxID=111780 RepID=K9XXG9_STAC7|nr:phosphotransferase [Stanieria cyanosphaera]AFZ36754.1 aminoglycoside phosphotransferase [Stanieria cyanosphaera PCC 7437]
MAFLLSTENVVNYLQDQQLCHPNEQLLKPIAAKEYKNFNLVVSFNNNRHFLIKQERFDSQEKTNGDLHNEWLINQFFNQFDQLSSLRSLASEVISFDSSSSILVLSYLPDHLTLSEIYTARQDFPSQLAASVGYALAQVHRLTWQQEEYQNYLKHNSQDNSVDKKPNFLRGLERIGPGVFAQICTDAIEFFKLYQRYPSLHQAVVKLYENFQLSCLTHNDLRLSNILVDSQWEKQLKQNKSNTSSLIKLIDWEFFHWGDPAFDLGILIAQYLQRWLNSLYINNALDLETSLRLATTPLEKLQPSIAAIMITYIQNFPKILKYYPQFILKTIQFAGLALIKETQNSIEYHEPFDNRAIATLQVAKSLLCYPNQALSVITGKTESDLLATQSVAA